MPFATSEYNDVFGPRAPRTPELFSRSRKELQRSSSSQLSAYREAFNSAATLNTSSSSQQLSSARRQRSRTLPRETSSRALHALEGFHDAAPCTRAPRESWKPAPRFHHHGGTEMPRRSVRHFGDRTPTCGRRCSDAAELDPSFGQGPVQEHGMETIDPSFAGLNAPPPPLGWFHSENYGRFGSSLDGEVRPWGSLSAANQR